MKWSKWAEWVILALAVCLGLAGVYIKFAAGGTGRPYFDIAIWLAYISAVASVYDKTRSVAKTVRFGIVGGLGWSLMYWFT